DRPHLDGAFHLREIADGDILELFGGDTQYRRSLRTVRFSQLNNDIRWQWRGAIDDFQLQFAPDPDDCRQVLELRLVASWPCVGGQGIEQSGQRQLAVIGTYRESAGQQYRHQSRQTDSSPRARSVEVRSP